MFLVLIAYPKERNRPSTQMMFSWMEKTLEKSVIALHLCLEENLS